MFCIGIALLLVGAVFIYTPGDIAAKQVFGFSGEATAMSTWVIYGVIFLYYLCATVFPIDAVIGRIYPVFGAILLFSAVGVFIGIFAKGYPLVELWDSVWMYNGVFNYSEYFGGNHFIPVFFVTVACGILSGFHSTQTAIISRTMKSEREGRTTFYYMMVLEGFIAMVWAAGAMGVYNLGLQEANASLATGTVGIVCKNILGNVGGIIALLGVIVLPITSGDTAFRSARLVLADWFKMDQKSWKNRLLLCVPVLGVGAFLGIGNALGKIDYTIIWRYFSWTNQTLAMIVLWAASMYLFYEKKNYWITAVPATFMSAVSITYFMLGNECLGQFLNTKTADGATVYNTAVAYPVGILAAALFLGIFLYTIKKRHTQPHYETLHK